MIALRSRLFVLMLISCVACALTSQAEIITLRTGQTVQGEILVSNDDVVIIRNAQGQRFQYPRADILSVRTEQEADNGDRLAVSGEQAAGSGKKKVSLSLELSGGGMSSPHIVNGGCIGGDLLVGTYMLADRHIFVGGGIGWHSYFGNGTYSFLPLQAVLRVPFIEGKHAPQIGVAVGCGFAVTKKASHGLYAGIDFGYRYQAKAKTALFVGIFLNFQQTNWDYTETLTAEDGQSAEFIVHSGSNLLGYGLKLAVLL
ncbi:MAG: hypothetical protein IJR74_05475 [Paludibacteraceae bacterium]|nr:hypothetical protein [Paludibacteraceae bacterium]